MFEKLKKVKFWLDTLTFSRQVIITLGTLFSVKAVTDGTADKIISALSALLQAIP